jgi:ABC-type transport system substrate-binding protein
MACAGPTPTGTTGSTGTSAAPAAPKTLVIAIRYEPSDLSPKIISQGATEGVKRPYNAFLGLMDGAGLAQPYLAEVLPELNTPSWQLFPDGRMETVHRLRPNLTWHDGAPLTADDFVFAWQVYSAPGSRVFTAKPQDLIDEVVASDARTILIRHPYPLAVAVRRRQRAPPGR